MITRVRHSPPRVDKARWFGLEGGVRASTYEDDRIALELISQYPHELSFGSSFEYLGDTAFLTVNDAKDLNTGITFCDGVLFRELIMVYYEQMGVCCLPMCDDLKWKVRQFLK